ncbi:MAG: MBL fold metallo-hydrolase [Dehalococcoidia bacterium]|nr:MAG: MBL fold metallo-hydrolase [Dehalococcoidia bacterium]
MNTETYRFKVGTFKCLVVIDGTHAYPYVPAWFINAPKERLEQVLREHNLDPEQYVSPYPSLVINTGQHRVLVDTGAGSMEPTTGRLIPNLQAEGISPEDIETVILTHGHPDHIGGNNDSEGKPAFPNARYVMWKDEWDFWTSSPSLAELELDEHLKQLLLTSAQNNLLPVQGQLDLVDHETAIVPGIRAVTAPGHTPGHMAIAIASNGEELLYLSDVVLHPIHLERPDWYAVFDFAPEQTVTTRRRLLQQAATEKALVHAFHFPFPGLGRVIQKGDAWQWQPV